MNQEFKPPADRALHALWVIRNWTRLPKESCVTWEEIVRKVNEFSSEVYEQISTEKE